MKGEKLIDFPIETTFAQQAMRKNAIILYFCARALADFERISRYPVGLVDLIITRRVSEESPSTRSRFGL
jgi:hypothetical protein